MTCKRSCELFDLHSRYSRLISNARWIMDDTFERVRLEVTYSNLEGDCELMAVASCLVQFDCAAARIYFPASYADPVLEPAPSRLRQMLELEVHQRLLE